MTQFISVSITTGAEGATRVNLAHISYYTGVTAHMKKDNPAMGIAARSVMALASGLLGANQQLMLYVKETPEEIDDLINK